MKNKGDTLKENRQTLELTQEGLAEILGVQRNTVYRWEAGLLDVPKIAELAVEALLDRHGLKQVTKATKATSKKALAKKGGVKK